MKIVKKFISAAIGLCVALLPAAGYSLPSASAATFSDINASEVFLKQQEWDTCTLCSNVMLMRRAAMLSGDSDWRTITESAMRKLFWVEDAGMYNYYTYRDFTVSYGRIQYDAKAELRDLLSRHPEGIVAYDYDYPHAILLTDYSNGVFYCADPANNTPKGRMSASNALISVSGVEGYWFVESPSLSLGGNLSSESKGTEINEKWQITSDSGVNLRSGAGIGYSVKCVVPYNTLLTVTKKAYSGSSLWGYTTYDSKTGWVSLNYAERVTTFPELKNTSKLNRSVMSVGEAVSINGSATGGSQSFDYCYSYRKEPGDEWVDIKGYSESKTAAFAPDEAGTYTIRIKVHDQFTGQVAQKGITLTVVKGFTNLSTISSDNIRLGNKITISGNAYGGSGKYEYSYSYRGINDSNWIDIKDYSDAKYVSFTPKRPGEYVIRVKVHDNNLNMVAQKGINLSVSNNFENNSYTSVSEMFYGESLDIQAVADGGTAPYTYAYYCRRNDSTSWYRISNYSDNDSITYMPKHSGKYEFLVKIKGADGKLASKTITVDVINNKLVNNSFAEAYEIDYGDTFCLTGSASGGSGDYMFAYYCRRAGTEKWTTIKSYSDNETVEYKPKKTGEYEIVIRAKDSSDKVVKKRFTINVNQPE